MTFYEAALRILEEAGSPLHSLEITKRSLDKSLLSHVGKTPEVTMLSRLAAMAKRSRERKIMVTARDTFGLTDWMLPEDDEALAATGTPEVNPEEDLPPMRPVERHPEPRAEYLRSIGRQAERKRRGDEDGRKRKLPPVAEVVFEIFSESQTALVPSELLARLKTRELVQDDLGIGAMLEALAADNQTRVDQNRRPQFAAVRAEGGELQLSVDAQTSVEGGPSLVELQAAFCQAAQLPFENGRVVLRSQRREREREALPDSLSSVISGDDAALLATAKAAVRDARRSMAKVFRKKLTDLDSGTFEKSIVRLLHGLHFRELKVARRSKEGPVLTARRKDGSLELRYAIRIMKSGSTERRNVQELRRDLGHHGAQLGLIISAGDARGDAKSESTGNGALVLLWCGDALAEKFFEAEVGVSVNRVELFEVDEAFFAQARLDAEEASKRREERHKERHGGERVDTRSSDARPTPTGNESGSDSAPTPPMGDAGSETSAPAPAAMGAPTDEGDDDEGEEGEDAPTDAGGAPSTEGGVVGEGGKRRRRRRRRRRGAGGPRPEGQASAPGAAASSGAAGPAPSASASAEPTAVRASAPTAVRASAPTAVRASAPTAVRASAPSAPAAAPSPAVAPSAPRASPPPSGTPPDPA